MQPDGTVPEDAPEHCPGTASESAGKSSACAGCPNQKICSSGQPQAVDPAIAEIRLRLASVKRKILVLSGKGGVGKSTFSCTLAHGLSTSDNRQVGLLDVDICGPSLPRMLGVVDEQVHQSASGWSPIFVTDSLSVMSVGFLLSSADDAVVWRGPRKNGLIKQFLRDVDWGELDALIVDTPPGTSDEHLTIAQYLGEAGVDGAVLVSTPQEVSLLDVRKEIDFCKKLSIRVLGVVENMSSFVCPKCHAETQVFPPTTGGVEKMAAELRVPFLGRIPLDPRIAHTCDEGRSFLEEFPDAPAAQAYRDVIEKILMTLEA